jgi:hypothetical protein
MTASIKYRVLGTIVFLMLSAGLFSQQYDCNCEVSDSVYADFIRKTLISRQYENPITGYSGGQYFNNWSPGRIILASGEIIENMTLRYDMYMDEVLWQRTTDFQIGVVNKEIVKGFDFYGDGIQPEVSFVKRKLRSTDTKNVYLQILIEGNLSLYVFRNLVSAAGESRTVDNTKYYIFSFPVQYIQVRLNRKNLLNLPGVGKDTIQAIIRTNRLNPIRNEADFTKAVYYYNQTRD